MSDRLASELPPRIQRHCSFVKEAVETYGPGAIIAAPPGLTDTTIHLLEHALADTESYLAGELLPARDGPVLELATWWDGLDWKPAIWRRIRRRGEVAVIATAERGGLRTHDVAHADQSRAHREGLYFRCPMSPQAWIANGHSDCLRWLAEDYSGYVQAARSRGPMDIADAIAPVLAPDMITWALEQADEEAPDATTCTLMVLATQALPHHAAEKALALLGAPRGTGMEYFLALHALNAGELSESALYWLYTHNVRVPCHFVCQLLKARRCRTARRMWENVTPASRMGVLAACMRLEDMAQFRWFLDHGAHYITGSPLPQTEIHWSMYEVLLERLDRAHVVRTLVDRAYWEDSPRTLQTMLDRQLCQPADVRHGCFDSIVTFAVFRQKSRLLRWALETFGVSAWEVEQIAKDAHDDSWKSMMLRLGYEHIVPYPQDFLRGRSSSAACLAEVAEDGDYDVVLRRRRDSPKSGLRPNRLASRRRAARRPAWASVRSCRQRSGDHSAAS